MDSREVVERFQIAQGWDDSTVLDLLCDYIDDVSVNPVGLRKYLADIADEENGFDDDHADDDMDDDDDISDEEE